MAGVAFLLAACAGADTGVVTFTDPENLSKMDIPESWNVDDDVSALLNAA